MGEFHCPQCGALCREGERFCTQCGASLASVTKCAECGALFFAEAGACHRCGCPVGAYTPPAAPAPTRSASKRAAPAGERTHLGLSVYNKLMLLLVLWPSVAYWLDLFTVKWGELAHSFGFLGFSDLAEQLAGGFELLHMEDEQSVATLLAVVKYIFIAAAVVAVIRYIRGWMNADNGRPVKLAGIMGCYILPVVLFLAAANIVLYVRQEDALTSLLTAATGKMFLLPTLPCVLSLAVPPVVGCIAKPFFSRAK